MSAKAFAAGMRAKAFARGMSGEFAAEAYLLVKFSSSKVPFQGFPKQERVKKGKEEEEEREGKKKRKK
uniref:Uncharacterized protein n=1 Tax=Oryza punctata TaxID=4537 RepID=A0A0E0KLY2_ORYPU